MVRARSLQDEVSQLRTEANKDRAKKKTRKKSVAPEPPDEVEQTEELATAIDAEKLKNLTKQLDELVHNAEDGIKDHPVASVLGAFALGILVGAVLRR